GTLGVSTTVATYDDADELLAFGSVTYQYDANGNVTRAGGNTYTWDTQNRLASAAIVSPTVATASYRYDRDGLRTSKTVTTTSTTTVNDLWDRASGLLLLVDDGTNAYLHAAGVLAQLETATGATPTYPLADGLGSIRGQTNTYGSFTGTADY